MDCIAFFGQGRVAERCRKLLGDLEIPIVKSEKADLWISVHHPEIFRTAPKLGILNLHNSYLPWNRGAHPCTWAIVDRTPHGATMHWIDHGIDTGPILCQQGMEILPGETADALYKRTEEVEFHVFVEAMTMLRNEDYRKIPQRGRGSFHLKVDFERLVRAMTTSDCKVVREA